MQSIILNPTDTQMLADPYGNFLWIDDDSDDILLNLHIRYMKRAVAAFGGRNRNVFLLPGGYVVKIPKNFHGIGDNDWEGSVSNTKESIDDPYYVQYPKTRLVYKGDVAIVFMEFITPMSSKDIISRFGEEPDWVDSVDGGQVGVNKNGRLVAYDYGIH